MIGLKSLRVACAPLVGAGMLVACSGGPAPSGGERLDRASSAVTSCAYNVKAQSSTPLLLKNPKVFFVFWGSYWQSGTGATTAAQVQTIWSSVASSPSFWNRLAEYQIGLGSYAGSASNTTPFPATGTITEQQVQAELDSEIASGLLPQPDPNTLYVLMLPPGLNDAADANDYAHHGYAPASGSVPAVPYAVMPYNTGANGSVISHEISEAATDPDTSSGYRDSSIGEGEIGDLCHAGPYPIGAAGWSPGPIGAGLQQMWSQKDCGCVTRHDPGSADFNGDWLADLAVTGSASDLTSTEVGVALSNGAGGFAATKLSTTDFNTYATQPGAVVLAGDFDGDGYADLAAAGVSSWNGVKVAYAHGDGTFASTTSIATTFGAAASTSGAKVIVTDVNGDGYADLVATGAPGATTIAVARGQAGHTFTVTNAASSFASLVSAAGASFAAGDVNNDGYDDLVAVGTSSTTLTVALSNGDGTFKIVTSTNATLAAALAQTGAKVVVGDVDGDAIGDIVIAGAPGATTVTVGHSNGDGTFTAETPFNGAATSFPSLAGTSGAVIVGGDYNGDMRADVLTTGVSSWTTVPMVTLVPTSNGIGSYNFTFTNNTSDFAGYAGQSNNRVASAIGYTNTVVSGPPAPATNVTAKAASSSSILVSWTASTTPGVSYGVFRGTVASFAPNASNNVGTTTATSFTDTGLSPSTTYYYYVLATDSGGIAPDSNEANATTLAGELAQINAGGGADSPYAADEDFSGGGTIDHANTIDLSGVTNPAPMAVYQDARTGTFTYTVPAPAGSSHVVRLHFAETYFSTAGSRVFNVAINGTQVLTNFDIYKTAGAKNKAVVEQFTETANSSGQYVIQFTTVVNSGLVSGIEIE